MEIIKIFKHIILGILGIITLFLLFCLIFLAIGLVGKGMALWGPNITDNAGMVCESASILSKGCINYGALSLFILLPSLFLMVIMIFSLAALGELVEGIYQEMKSKIILKRKA